MASTVILALSCFGALTIDLIEVFWEVLTIAARRKNMKRFNELVS
jgi:hypothetical protein